MSNRKLSLQGFFHQLGRLYRKITKSFVTRVLRYVLFYQRRGKLSTAGFILPTTVLLILVVALTVGALTFRAYNRNIQVIGDAQQRVIYNAATPAIDRARSKLEFLFDSTKDTRLPSGVPSQATLEAMLLNNGTIRNKDGTFTTGFPTLPYKDAANKEVDAYTFPDETRININKDGKVDNAWYFRTDTNGDGKLDDNDSTVVYSIISSAPPATLADQAANTQAKTIATRLLELTDAEKAAQNLVRQAPLSVDGALGCARNTGGGNAGPDGWFEDKTSSAILRKNFQVDALVIPGNAGGTKATLEFTQDRQLDRGNKWGAWFRHDLEIYPGAQMNWNGAMHTEGSLIIGSLDAGGPFFTAYLISSPESCLFTPSASEITVTDRKGNTPTTNLQGLVAAGVVGRGSIDPQKDKGTIHLHSSNPTANAATVSNTTGSSAATNPIAITSDPETVMLENGYTTIPTINNAANPDRNNRGANLTTDANRKRLFEFGDKQRLPQRISANPASAPYVDDLYRADDLWGPKPKYKDKESATVPDGQFGKPIPSENSELVNNNVSLEEDSEASGVGLDGYWERRARVKGLRVLVGQRLELGNLFTWYAPRNLNSDDYVANDIADVDQPNYEHEGDPLYPVTVKPYPVTPSGRVSHVDLQRRTLRDNLSAVQSTAIYHAAADGDKDYPIACLATTSHPGTLWTLRQALTFRPFFFSGIDSSGTVTPTSLLTNFFTGIGTNGWEFNTPGGDYNGFVSQVQSPTSSLRKALQNLANFAGDHQTVGGALKSGAFPPTPNDNVVHPYPALSMWGNYSNLKRALMNLSDRGNDFSKLSIADKTYIQTAACTLGMLAYNISEIQKFDPSAVSGNNVPNDKDLGLAGTVRRRLMAKLGRDLWQLMDGINTGPLTGNPEVLHQEQMSTYGYGQTTTHSGALYNPADYQSVPPEAFIGALRQYLLRGGTSVDGTALKPDSPEFIEEMRLAETIMLHHQIRRDRTFGFKPSPRFGKYRVLPPGPNNPIEMAAACDPDQFVFADTDGDKVLRDDIARFSDPSLLSKTSTVLSSTGLTAVTPVNSTGFPKPVNSTNSTDAVGRSLPQYRLALSRLCGTLDATGNQVLPKFPALYYLFPEARHSYRGSDPSPTSYDSQPVDEPYIADPYVADINASFEPISTTLAPGRAGYPSPPLPIPSGNELSRIPDPSATTPTESVRIFPVPDLSMSAIALAPRPRGEWKLPNIPNPNPNSFDNKANFMPNLVLQVDALKDARKPEDNLTREDILKGYVLREKLEPLAIPFLDRAFFDGRQLMLARTLDIDLGMLRSRRFENKNDVWLPVSGIVYGFREDAVREDAISRPTCGATVCEMNLQDPANPIDPKVRRANSTEPSLRPGENGISTKAIDKYPDPDRRIHGFRLRNGMQLKRDRSLEGAAVNAADNIKGLSFFTDQPVYIQGDYNLHQDGTDNTTGTPLEEFSDSRLADDYSNFYTRRTPDNNFAKPDRDRWRPSEILADSITVLSNGFCDGSIADTFLQYTNDPGNNTTLVDSYTRAATRYPLPDARTPTYTSTNAGQSRSYYHEPRIGLFDPGCLSANYTSFHNQNRPAQTMVGKTPGTRNSGWDWVRENSRYDAVASRRPNAGSNQDGTGQWVDITAPVKISRSGHPLVVRPRDVAAGDAALQGKVRPPVPYNVAFPNQTYYNYGGDVAGGSNFYANYGGSDGKGNRLGNLTKAVDSSVNSIVVSGISPSRPNQGYGGLHNFPRFLETWEGKKLKFSGSFIQLSYTNYATAPFELENLEPWTDTSKIPSDPLKDNSESTYYKVPARLWGYDVALQYSPAGPAAARFVTPSKNRSEYYVEPPANDPYIANLCEAAKARPELNLNTSCPRKGEN